QAAVQHGGRPGRSRRGAAAGAQGRTARGAGPGMNVTQALAQAAGLGIERLDAQVLLLHALRRSETDRGWLLAHDTDAIPSEGEHAFAAACARRADGEPLAYIVGHKEFHGIDLKVDARVLVPRPDTETLVDWAI